MKVVSVVDMKRATKQFVVGQPHPFLWPKISSFLTLQALNSITQHISENKQWNVSEKLDGCNVCVSSNGWLASRNKILGNIEDENLGEQIYQGAPLSQVKPLYEQVKKLQEHLASTFFKEEPDFQLLAYGELIPPGTASSVEDIYHYENRHINVGNIYVFALGLVLKDQNRIPLIFKHGFLNTENVSAPCFIVPMNNYLSLLLQKFDILHIAPRMATSLSNILHHPIFNNDLAKRKKEGYILSGNEGQGYIKWKYYKTCSPVLDQQAHYLVENQWSYEGRTMAKTIQSLYKEADKFINFSKDSQLDKQIDYYMNTRSEDMVEKFYAMYSFGKEYHEMMFTQFVLEAYNWIKHNSDFLLDPKVKIQLRKRLANQIRMYLKSFDYTSIDVYGTK